MSWIWVTLMALIGGMMVIGGATKGTFIPYRWLHARASMLWEDRAHPFLLVSGLVICTLAALWGFGAIW